SARGQPAFPTRRSSDLRLGESFEWSEDGTELTVKLREGVTWTDGEAFDAEDVVFSQTNEAAKRDFVVSVEALDTHTVKWVFDSRSEEHTSELQSRENLV